jgi:hypothetical protein
MHRQRRLKVENYDAAPDGTLILLSGSGDAEAETTIRLVYVNCDGNAGPGPRSLRKDGGPISCNVALGEPIPATS